MKLYTKSSANRLGSIPYDSHKWQKASATSGKSARISIIERTQTNISTIPTTLKGKTPQNPIVLNSVNSSEQL